MNRVATNVYAVYVSGRYSNTNSRLKRVFDNPESATAYLDYLNKGLEKYSPYKIEIKEITVYSEWDGKL